MWLRGALVGAVALLVACGDESGTDGVMVAPAPSTADAGPTSTAAPASTTPTAATTSTASTTSTAVPGTTGVPSADDALLDARPYRVVLPAELGPDPAPVVVLLHGYSATAELIAAEVGLLAEAERRGVVTVLPDGRVDQVGNQFWNATEACCDFWAQGPDDSTYLAAVIRDVLAEHPVDPERVLVIGHSNGGFMAYRLACDHAELVSGIASLAGAMFLDPAQCAPSRPVDVVQVHGTLDPVIGYAGGLVLGSAPHLGALDSVRMWAASNECATTDPVPVEGLLDVDGTVDGTVDGAEATLATVAGCPPGGTVALVTAERGGHFPWGGPDLLPTLFDLLLEPTT
jgi:polyhydroxybutyrate depolymerase